MEKTASVYQNMLEKLDRGLIVASSLMGAYFLIFFTLEVIPSEDAAFWQSIFALCIGGAAGLVSFVFIGNKISQTSSAQDTWTPPLFWVTAAGQTICAVALFALPASLHVALWFITWFFVVWSFVCLGCRFSALPLRRRILATVFSTAGACAITLLLTAFGTPSVFAVISILPLGAIACLIRSPFPADQKTSLAEEKQCPCYFEGKKAQFSPAFLAAVFFYSASWALAMGYTNNYQWPMLAGGLASAIVAIGILTVHKSNNGFIQDANSAYRPAPLALALSFLALAIGIPWGEIWMFCLACAGFSWFFVYFWIVVGNHVQRFDWNPSETFSFALAPWLGGIACGFCLIEWAYIIGIEIGTVAAWGLFLVAAGLWTTTRGKIFANEPHEKSSVHEVAPVASAEDEKVTASVDPLESFAKEHALSRRETEITRLLSKGRNVPFICDELFIAKSIVQTHIKHIYSKTGVSTRQELIDLLDKTQ
ncbi:LuxR C-terminal-related transcriptional regulator [Eggerthellaceae bacterium 3-80]|nr:DNA-binding response regulator [bacterium D16-34]